MGKKDLKTLVSYLKIYKLNCGIIKEEDIRKIVDYYGYDVSDKKLKKIVDSKFYYSDGYYTGESSIINSDFIQARGNLSIRLLSEDEIFDFSLKESNIVISINEIVNDFDLTDKIIYSETSFKAFTGALDEENSVMKKFGISRSQFKKIVKIFNDNIDAIRYGLYYGRTEEEYDLELLLDEMVMRDKPKERTLNECLNLLDDDCKKNIYDYYDLDLNDDKIIDSILDSFKSEVNDFGRKLYNSLINEEFSYDISEDNFYSGYVFAYMEDGSRKICVPNEIMEILKSVNYNDLDDDSSINMFGNFLDSLLNSTDDMSLDDYLMGYISMNGVIEKDFLRKLLKDKHNIDVSVKEMDKILKDYDVNILGKYYCLFDGKDDIKKLYNVKKSLDDYKTLTKDIRDIELDFMEDINNYTNDNWYNDEYKKEEIKVFIWQSLKFGIYNKEMLDLFTADFKLGKKDSRLIDDFCKKYKNKIAVWTLNGYTLCDKNQVKSEKIGRNDSCPCGSGKKYKKCCGG